MKLTCLVITVLTLCSCVMESQDDKVSSAGGAVEIVDTVRKDIPKDDQQRPLFFYRELQRLAPQLGINSLENGYDSMTIRIWFTGMVKTQQLLILQNAGKEWAGKLCNYNTRNGQIDTSSVRLEWREIRPSSGWHNFTQLINTSGILELPHSSNGGADGSRVTIETATKHTYRIFSYWCPDVNASIDPNAKRLNDFVSLLEREFGFKKLQHCD